MQTFGNRPHIYERLRKICYHKIVVLASILFGHIRAAYTRKNKPWITQSAAYVSRDLLI